MKTGMDAVCSMAYPSPVCPYSGIEAIAKCVIGIPGAIHATYFAERVWCSQAADIYRVGLGLLGGPAYTGRQVEYCRCCPQP